MFFNCFQTMYKFAIFFTSGHTLLEKWPYLLVNENSFFQQKDLGTGTFEFGIVVNSIKN